MRNKAFTLVELLAVIIILGALALIVTPVVLNIINDSKRSTAMVNADEYIKAVNDKIVESLDTTVSTPILDGTYTISDLTDLGVEVSGSMPTGRSVTIDGKRVSTCTLIMNGFKFNCLGTGVKYEGNATEVDNILLKTPNISVDNPDWTTSKVVTITAETNGAQLQYRFNSGEWININSGHSFTLYENKTIYARTIIEDRVSETATLQITKIDTTLPVITIGTVSSTTKSISIPITATDNESGIKSVECSLGTDINNLNNTVQMQDKKCEFNNLTNNTTYYYKVTATNRTNQDITVNGSYSTGDFVNVNISVDVPGISASKMVTIAGVTQGAQLQYQLNGTDDNNWININSGYSFKITANTTIYARLTDNKNVSSTATLQITNIDTTGPVISSFAKSNINATGGVTLTATASDSGIGTISGYYISTSSTPPTSSSSWQTSNAVSGKKTGTYYVWAKDSLGNISASPVSAVVYNKTQYAYRTRSVTNYGWSRSCSGTYTSTRTVTDATYYNYYHYHVSWGSKNVSPKYYAYDVHTIKLTYTMESKGTSSESGYSGTSYYGYYECGTGGARIWYQNSPFITYATHTEYYCYGLGGFSGYTSYSDTAQSSSKCGSPYGSYNCKEVITRTVYY